MIRPDEFAKLMIKALRAQGIEIPIHFDAEAFRLKVGEDAEKAPDINLAHVYNEYTNASKNQRPAIIENFAKLFAKASLPYELPTDYAIARSRLGLCLSTVATLDGFRVHGELNDLPAAEARAAHRRLTDELVVTLVYDDGDLLRHLREKNLTRWSVTIEIAMRDATMNLVEKGLVIEQVGSVFCVRMMDSYDAARIVLVEMLRQLPVKGRPVALAPDRDCLIITGSEDMEGLTQMAAMGHVSFEENTRVISARPVVLEGNSWAAFEPPEPVNRTFRQLAQAHEQLDYHGQAMSLRELHRKRKDNTSIAEVVNFPTGTPNEFVTMTRWESGVPALLPQADVVAFADLAAGAGFLAEWKDVVRIVRHRMERTQDVPPRYRVVSFPTPEELQAMSAKTIRLDDLKRSRPRPA